MDIFITLKTKNDTISKEITVQSPVLPHKGEIVTLNGAYGTVEDITYDLGKNNFLIPHLWCRE